MLPELEPGSGYLLNSDDIEVDWIVFRDRARRSAGLEGYDRVELALSALELVRGPVLVHALLQRVDHGLVRDLVHSGALAGPGWPVRGPDRGRAPPAQSYPQAPAEPRPARETA